MVTASVPGSELNFGEIISPEINEENIFSSKKKIKTVIQKNILTHISYK